MSISRNTEYLITMYELFDGEQQKLRHIPMWYKLFLCTDDDEKSYKWCEHMVGFSGYDEGSELYVRYSSDPFQVQEHAFKILSVKLGGLFSIPSLFEFEGEYVEPERQEIEEIESESLFLIQRYEFDHCRQIKKDVPIWVKLFITDDCNDRHQVGYKWDGLTSGFAGYDDNTELYVTYNNEPIINQRYAFKILKVRLGYIKDIPVSYDE